ncbi:MAG: hypothetical protein MZV70_08430 [Desulfobacterales bacterium]|nr:hypothetical protein [Desulfobacterales bacterium]
MTVLEERTVGPSLGAGLHPPGHDLPWLVGGAPACSLFMALYYKLSGLLADFEVLLDIVLIARRAGRLRRDPDPAGHRRHHPHRSAWRVDNNVLIYERIREELRLGKTPRGAVDAGFDRATTDHPGRQRHHPDCGGRALPVRHRPGARALP